jgi:hypothetical protein
MQVTYRSYKRECTFYFSSLFDNAHYVTFRCVRQKKKLLSTVRLKYFSAYVYTDVVVKFLELTSMHADVKYKFIRSFGVTAQKLDMKIMYIKIIIKAYVMNKNKNVKRCLERSQCKKLYLLKAGLR